MKVGFVIYGGLETMSGGYLYDRLLVEHLRSRGDLVRVISLPAASYFSHLVDNLHFRLPGDLEVLIEDELVHASLLAANSVQADGLQHCPVISLVHNLHSSEKRPALQNAFYRQVEKRYLEGVDGFIFNSETTRRVVQGLVSASKPYVIATPGGDRLGSIELQRIEERAVETGPLRLLFLANVTPLKGLHVLLDALDHLPAGTCSLDVAGSLEVDPDYARTMQAKSRSLHSPVTFHGLLAEGPLIELLNRDQVLVLPSFYEGFGIAIVEGMAFGLPAIGTTAGAMPQMIRDGENGYVIRLGDSMALSEILRGLAQDRNLLHRLGANALKEFQARPTWSQSAEKIRGFLLEMVGRA